MAEKKKNINSLSKVELLLLYHDIQKFRYMKDMILIFLVMVALFGIGLLLMR